MKVRICSRLLHNALVSLPIGPTFPEMIEMVDANDRLKQPGKFLSEYGTNTTGLTLTKLLDRAGYSFEAQGEHLKRYRTAVIPAPGASPSDDGSEPIWRQAAFQGRRVCAGMSKCGA